MTPGPAHLATGLAGRERRHRRLRVAGVVALILLGASPVWLHHAPVASSLPALRGLAAAEHIGALCLTALHLLLLPVHRLVEAAMAAGLAWALWDRGRAWRTHRAALAALAARVPAAHEPFARAAAEAGVPRRRLRVVAGLPDPAFTTGLLVPRIYLAEELASRLSAAELAAVIAHEGAHARRRDPLRVFALRLLASALFWVPAMRRLADDLRDEAEILADDAAARQAPLALASAIVALAAWRPAAGIAAPLDAAAVGFRRDPLLERRVRRLAGEDAPVRTRLTLRSSLVTAAALVALWGCGVVMSHPLPTRAAPATAHAAAAHVAAGHHHCDHPGTSALAHLFCLDDGNAGPHDCPHAHRDG